MESGPLSGRLAFRSAMTVVAFVTVTALALSGAVPAHADQVRQRQQWVLNALDVPAAWRVTRGTGVTVAVIDSGVDPAVSDLAGSVVEGPNYTNVGTPPSDPNWGIHGTWMASLIAGHGHGPGASDGILGVAPRAKILSIRVITDRSDPRDGQYRKQPGWRGQRELANGIRYAVRRGAGVISMSLGYNESSLRVRSALQYALDHNVVVVASSGNAGTHSAQTRRIAPYSFPADYPGVIGVAAVTQSGQPAYFSSQNLSVSVAAPGVNVPAEGRGSKYWVVSGTSPACALTAGVAALIKAKFPKLNAAQVRFALTRSTARRPSGGYDDYVGFGTVDAAAALRMAGRLARQVPGGDTQSGKSAAVGHFGSGRMPVFPVAPRDRRTLLVFLGIGVGSLLLVIIALVLLIGGRRRRRIARQANRGMAAGPPLRSGPPGAGGAFAGPIAGGAIGGGLMADGAVANRADPHSASGPELDVRYPTQIYPAQPRSQVLPVQGYLGNPGQGLPVQGYLGQPGQAQLGPGGQPPQAGPAGAAGHPGPPGQFGPAGPPEQPGPRGPGQFGQIIQAGPVEAGPVQPGSAQPMPPALGPGQYSQPSPSGHGFADAGYPGPGASPAGQPGLLPDQPSLRAEHRGPVVSSGGHQAQDAAPPSGAAYTSHDDWLFEDGPSQPAGPGPAAGGPPDSDSATNPQADHQHSAVTPPDPGTAKWLDDPLTSPRYSRQNLPRDDARWRAFRSDWLTRGHDVTEPPTSEPGGWFEPQPAADESAVAGADPVGADSAQPRQPLSAGEPEPRWRSRSPARAGQPEAAGPALTEPAVTEPAGQPPAPPEPAMRSVWEPLVRHRPAVAATDHASERAGVVADASADSASVARRTDMSRQPESATTSPSRPLAEPGASPAEAEAGSRADGPSAADSVPSEAFPAEPGPPRESATGAEPLPRRRPMTHLAAPLRRERRSQAGRLPQAGRQEQAEAADKVASVWDTWRPTAAMRRAAQAELSESGDDTT